MCGTVSHSVGGVAGSAEPAAADFQMTAGMEAGVVSFLLKMSFMLSDGNKESKDREAASLMKHNQILFSEALALWTRVSARSLEPFTCPEPLKVQGLA